MPGGKEELAVDRFGDEEIQGTVVDVFGDALHIWPEDAPESSVEESVDA